MLRLRDVIQHLQLTPNQLAYLHQLLQPPTDFATTLRHLRRKRKLTKYRLARRANLSPGTITRLEAGQRNPSRRTLAKLTLALNLNPAETQQLYNAAGYLPPQPAPQGHLARAHTADHQ